MRRLLFVALILACRAPSKDSDASADPPIACTKLGATCTVSPGKLGTCVEVEAQNGSASSTFVCQSQH